MDDETRIYVKNLIADAADAKLIIGITQRCEQVLSRDDIAVLTRCYVYLMKDVKEYLQIDEDGLLIGIEDIPPIIAGEGVASPKDLPNKEQKKTTVIRRAE